MFMAVLVVMAACMPMQPRTPPGDAPGAVQIGKDGAPMALVPAGEFTMGADSLDNPRHPIYLDAFYMDKYEVTTSRHAGIVNATGQALPPKLREVRLGSLEA